MSITSDRLMRLILGDWRIFRKSHDELKEKQLDDLETVGNFLLSRRGEASGTVLAQRLLDNFESATAQSQLDFFLKLAERFGADQERLQQAIKAYQDHPCDETVHKLHLAAEPRRQELIRRLNYSSGGTYRLIKMRERLHASMAEHPQLTAVDTDFAHLFTSWFNPGFLEMKPMNWHTPASILEKLIKYEAVHTIHDWADLRNRLDPVDRYCFGFFHPQLVDEPLIFVEVALSKDIPGSIQQLLDGERTPTPPDEATTAVFYSISNTQKGLSGVPFGSFLLKHVIDYLKKEIPSLTTYVTLSPAPGFAKWLTRERAAEKSAFIAPDQREALRILDLAGWQHDEQKVEVVRDVLLECARAYFLLAKTSRGTPQDPVSRFHLRNGAELHRIHFMGDTSANGMRQAFGLMVNYLYVPDDIEKNHEAFVERGEIVASDVVKAGVSKTPAKKGKRGRR